MDTEMKPLKPQQPYLTLVLLLTNGASVNAKVRLGRATVGTSTVNNFQ